MYMLYRVDWEMKMTMNLKQVRSWNKVVVAYFKALPEIWVNFELGTSWINFQLLSLDQ
jgi:hypothetical protein